MQVISGSLIKDRGVFVLEIIGDGLLLIAKALRGVRFEVGGER